MIETQSLYVHRQILVSPGSRRESTFTFPHSTPGQLDTMPAVSIEKAKAVLSEFVLVNQETSIDKIVLGKFLEN